MENILIVTGVCVVMPVMIMWIIYRAIINSDNQRAAVLMEAIRSNNSIDADRIAEAFGKARKTPRELLNLRLLRGCIFTLVGVATAISLIIMIIDGSNGWLNAWLLIISGTLLAVGISYLIVYFVTRKHIENNQAE